MEEWNTGIMENWEEEHRIQHISEQWKVGIMENWGTKRIQKIKTAKIVKTVRTLSRKHEKGETRKRDFSNVKGEMQKKRGRKRYQS
jgi:hypothetical protein